MTGESEDTRELWNRLADDWQIQVGEAGDPNRRLISDPVLWRLAGEVRGLRVLDAGCGTGYLSRQLSDRGADVVGVDFSERMIEIARTNHSDLVFQVDSCAELRTIDARGVDLVIANYVLMDVADLDGTMRAFARVLRPGGAAVLVFSHPCFPQGRASRSEDGGEIRYHWDFPYFEPSRRTDPPWAHFKSSFTWFHRPLSDYWKVFVAAGFVVEELEEPRADPERVGSEGKARILEKSERRPYSIAFRLRKPRRSLG